jgi:hypothetical protein
MKPLPLREETKVLCLNNPQSLARIRSTHVMVQPQSGHDPFVTQSHHNLAATGALHMDVRRLVLARR